MDLLTLHDVQAALERKNPRIATSPSGIPISVWQAGDESSATNFVGIAQHHSGDGHIGGGHAWWSRARALQKNKSDRNETKSHRCILVQDLPGAMHASFLKRGIDEHYKKFIHETQCGCAKGRGTCMAGQILELATNFSKGRRKCWGRLYLDLSAAFDSILREFLIAESTDDVQQLQSSLKALNISDEMCDQIVREAITERNLIEKTGRHIAFPQRRAKMRELCHATDMLARSEPGHKIRETMPKRKQTIRSQRTTNWLTLCSRIHVSLCTSVNNSPIPCVFRA